MEGKNIPNSDIEKRKITPSRSGRSGILSKICNPHTNPCRGKFSTVYSADVLLVGTDSTPDGLR